MRRFSVVDLMLIGTVLLWRSERDRVEVLAAARMASSRVWSDRYLAAIILFWVTTYARERLLRIARRDLRLSRSAGDALHQPACFVYGIKWTSASTVALMFGTKPAVVGLLSMLAGSPASAALRPVALYDLRIEMRCSGVTP